MIYDAHCHPTEHAEFLDKIAQLDATLCIMATNFDDFDLVRQTARSNTNVIPAFGIHPWFSHLLSFGGSKQEHYTSIFGPDLDAHVLQLLPEPIPVQDHIDRINAALEEFPHSMVGEIGLDKAFKVNIAGEISIYKTSMDHQRKIFRLQMELAAKFDRAVSVHGVQCHLPVLEECTAIIKAHKNTKMRICLHSFGGTPDFASQRWIKLPIPIYFSISMLVNSRNRTKAIELIKRVPNDRFLSESDYSKAGDRMLELVQQSLELLAEGGVDAKQVETNFWRFIRGE